MRSHATAVALSLLLAASSGHADMPAIGPTLTPTPPPPPTPPAGAVPGGGAAGPAGGTASVDTQLLSVAPGPTEPIFQMESASPPTVGDVLGAEGDVRLVGRIDINGFATGALQVFHGGAFGAVCDSNFGDPDADVACRELGFVGGTSLPLALAGENGLDNLRSRVKEFVAPFVLDNLNCTGSEDSLLACPGAMIPRVYDYDVRDELNYESYFGYNYYYLSSGSSSCEPLRGGYAFVACGMIDASGGQDRGDLRLNLGDTSEDGTAQFGRLEIFDNGGWGRVCDFNRPDTNFDAVLNNAPLTAASVNVACQQLGFDGGEKTQIAVDQTAAEMRRIPIAIAGANCTGQEARLTDCPGIGLGGGTEQCGIKNTVYLICSSDTDPDMEGSLRLMDGQAGPAYEYGRLEVFLKGFWSTICATESFTPDSAQVACSILGYSGGAPLQFRTASFGLDDEVLVASLPVGLASVDCNGTETSLLQCRSSQDEIPNCRVPDSQFTDATVLACANSVANCSEPAGTQGALRLRGGFGSPCDPIYTGFVEIFHLQEWGAICARPSRGGVNPQSADVICRQLGFPHGTLVDSSINPPDPGSDYRDPDYSFSGYEPEEAEEPQERFWLNEVSCRGPEDRLTECDLGQGFRRGNAGCTRQPSRLTVACRTFAISEALEDVTTPGAEEGDVRLVNQSAVANWQMGRLEVFFEGSWSQVCSEGFNGADADVACRQMGFGAGTVGPTAVIGAFPPRDRLVYPEVALTLPGCSGTETSLLDCPGDMGGPGDAFTPEGCFRAGNSGLMIACVADAQSGEEGALRLVDGGDDDDPDGGTGVLEIFHAGAWGSVCDGNAGGSSGPGPALTGTSAVVACRQLGFSFDRGGFQSIESVPENITISPSWLGALPCPRLQDTVLECGGLAFGDTGNCGLPQRLICDAGSVTAGGAIARLQPRLVSGGADPDGAWEYGRLELFDGEAFSSLREGSGQHLGRRGAEVACRTLGFSTGAQLLSGELSGLPGADGTPETLGVIVCTDDADALSDCTVMAEDYDYGSYISNPPGDKAVALICFSPSGCPATNATPSQGDVRLVNIAGTNFTSQPCDDVHFGVVELFNDGQWGRICAQFLSQSTVDAKVICRQLGFPFGSLIDVNSVSSRTSSRSLGYEDYAEDDEVVWATDVQCTGKEERLADCFFPQAFGEALKSAPTRPGAPPRPGGPGVPAMCGFRDFDYVAVACRQFELEESDVIRRL